MAIKKATKLQAVNTIISNIGQAPVTNLESGNPLVEMAEQILDEISISVQAEGWEYNTERGYPFTPNTSNEIVIPDNVLQLDSTPGDGKQTVIRNGKLYDRVKHTYTFDGQQKLDVMWLFDFESLPEAFKNYIAIRAANVFAGRSVGSKEAVIARATLMEYDTQQGNYTIFSDSDGNDTYQQFSYRPINVLLRM